MGCQPLGLRSLGGFGFRVEGSGVGVAGFWGGVQIWGLG